MRFLSVRYLGAEDPTTLGWRLEADGSRRRNAEHAEAIGSSPRSPANPLSRVENQMRMRIPTLMVAVVVLALASFANVAFAGKGGGGGKGGGVLSCDQAPVGGKGPLDSKYVKSTGQCFDNVQSALKVGVGT